MESLVTQNVMHTSLCRMTWDTNVSTALIHAPPPPPPPPPHGCQSLFPSRVKVGVEVGTGYTRLKGTGETGRWDHGGTGGIGDRWVGQVGTGGGQGDRGMRPWGGGGTGGTGRDRGQGDK